MTMDISGKIWGYTSKLLSRSNVEIFRIVGKETGESSTHKHQAKWSMFFVEKGKIEVTVEKNSYNLVDITILNAMQSIIIEPGEYHKFKILEEGTIAYEFYWVELDSNDIQRKNCGSIEKSA
jgi:quercetin dioxygenase-like cupin family protein